MLKKMNLIIVIAVIISISSILGVYIIMSNSITDTVNHITLTNITTNPKIIHAGDHFTMNVTVNNIGAQTIYFFTYYISGTFNRNVQILHYSGCSEMWAGNILMPKQSMELALPSSGCYYYVANSTGITNSTIELQYDIQKMRYTVNASKEFTIFS